MSLKRSLILAVLFSCFALTFQNCSSPSPDVLFSSESKKTNSDSDSGQPYDGKVFVLLGNECADGTRVQSRVLLTGKTSAELIRKDCKDITPVKLDSSEFQLDAAGLNQLTYQNQTFVSLAPEVNFIKPILVNPASPFQFGAKCDGVTDDSVAFQDALRAGDVFVPAGTCLINQNLFISISNRHLECAEGAVLLRTNPYAGRMIKIVPPAGKSISDVSIVNCHFLGSNTIAPQFYPNDNRRMDIPVQANDSVHNLLIAGNTFDRFFGQSMFQTYAASAAESGSGYRIIYNTFRSCGYYGPLFTGTANGLIAHNTLIDCSAGVENDDTLQATGGNLLEYNFLKPVYGYGASYLSSAIFLSGGTDAAVDYSTNIVRFNTVSGVSSANGFRQLVLPSHIFEWRNNGGRPAQYDSNSCIEGCLVVR